MSSTVVIDLIDIAYCAVITDLSFFLSFFLRSTLSLCQSLLCNHLKEAEVSKSIILLIW